MVETLVTLAFLSFFFIYLIQLLSVINNPFKVGQDRGDDDVSLFLLYECVVHARTAGHGLDSAQVVAIAELAEEQETQVASFDAADETATDAAAELQDTIDEATAEVVEQG